MSLSEKIKEERMKKKLTQENLADMLEVTRQSVQKWESGQSQPDLEKIIRLSYIFNVTTDYLLKDGNEDKNIVNSAEKPRVFILGYRDKAPSIFHIIILFVIVIALLLGYGIYLLTIASGSIIWLCVTAFILFLGSAIFFGANLIQYIIAYVNNKKATNQVLTYDPSINSFICYNVLRSNQKIVIRNGNILSISGSTFNTGKALNITYINDAGKKKRKTIGYCSNIDNYDLKNKINEYQIPKI